MKLLFPSALLSFSLLACHGIACASGAPAPVTTVLQDYGTKFSTRLIAVSTSTLRVMDNGYACSVAYLRFNDGKGREESATWSSTFYEPNACQAMDELLAAAAGRGGSLPFRQMTQLRQLKTVDDGEVKISLSCSYALATEVPGGKKLIFQGQRDSFCDAFDRR